MLLVVYIVLKTVFSQQSIARKKSSDGKIEYIMASMLIVLLDVWMPSLKMLLSFRIRSKVNSLQNSILAYRNDNLYQ